MRKAALFDLDGVIVDTEPCYTVFWQKIGAEYFPEDPDFAYKIKGHTLTYILDRYFSKDSQERIQQLLEEHQQTMSYPLIAGVLPFVDALRSRGVGVAVVTSSDQAKMQGLYRQHPDFVSHFDRIFTAEDALRSKPAPDCYIAAARYFGLEAAETVVFEDSFNGLEAGRKSGALVVGLTTSNTAAELRDRCDLTVADFQQPEVLLPLFGIMEK